MSTSQTETRPTWCKKKHNLYGSIKLIIARLRYICADVCENFPQQIPCNLGKSPIFTDVPHWKFKTQINKMKKIKAFPPITIKNRVAAIFGLHNVLIIKWSHLVGWSCYPNLWPNYPDCWPGYHGTALWQWCGRRHTVGRSSYNASTGHRGLHCDNADIQHQTLSINRQQ
jgi:hypothetical protein